MKSIISGDIGHDGGKYALEVESGNLQAKIAIPLVKVLDPIKVNFVDKLKRLIPGEWDDKLIDEAWAKAVASLAD